MDNQISTEVVRQQAEVEFAAEEHRRQVDAYKKRLAFRKQLINRVFPWRIKIYRKDDFLLTQCTPQESTDLQDAMKRYGWKYNKHRFDKSGNVFVEFYRKATYVEKIYREFRF